MATSCLNRLSKHRKANNTFVAVCSGRIESMSVRRRFPVRFHILEVLNREYILEGTALFNIARKTPMPQPNANDMFSVTCRLLLCMINQSSCIASSLSFLVTNHIIYGSRAGIPQLIKYSFDSIQLSTREGVSARANSREVLQLPHRFVLCIKHFEYI